MLRFDRRTLDLLARIRVVFRVLLLVAVVIAIIAAIYGNLLPK
jgi:ABC-type microcin C transport system permease subunit YejE